MTEISEAALVWFAKCAGAIAGSAVSLAYLLPAGRREAAIRFAVGLTCRLVFGGAAGLKIARELGIEKAIGPAEMALMGAAAASLFAWWALGIAIRTLMDGGWTRFLGGFGERKGKGVDDAGR